MQERSVQRGRGRNTRQRRTRVQETVDSDEQDEDEEYYCGECGGKYEEDDELCDGGCEGWYHVICVGIDEESYLKTSVVTTVPTSLKHLTSFHIFIPFIYFVYNHFCAILYQSSSTTYPTTSNTPPVLLPLKYHVFRITRTCSTIPACKK